MRQEKYRDMYDLPSFVSKTHKRMSMIDRAAQFSPFKALTGYEDELSETIRETSLRRIATSDKAEEIERKLALLEKEGKNKPTVKVIYFVKDEKKEGGHYMVFEGEFLKIDPYEKTLVFSSFRLPIDSIIELEGEIFLSL